MSYTQYNVHRRVVALIVVFSAALLLALMPLTASIYASPASGDPPNSSPLSLTPYDWLQFNGDAQHSGNNTKETIINSDNVRHLTRIFQVSLPSTADGAPMYLAGISTPLGTRDVVYVTTRAGDIVALDGHTGGQIWAHSNPAGSCKINNGGTACYTTSSPVIDPNRQFVYSYGLDGKVHKYAAGNGTETLTGGWPEIATLKGFDEKGSPPMSLATSGGTTYLYVANGGYPGDGGDYQGHITAINLATGTQNVFNSLCSNQAVHFVTNPGNPDCPQVQSAIWSRASVVYSAANNKIYMATGNGTFNPAAHNWGDTIFALNPDGTGSNGNPLDTYTPTNFAALQSADADLGSTAPAILPVPANSKYQHLAVQSGKDAKLRLINLDNLSGTGSIGQTGGEIGAIINVPQGNEVLTAPAVWVNSVDGTTWVFVANDNGVSGLQLQIDGSGNPSLATRWNINSPGSSPLVANDVLYLADSSNIKALSPTTGSQLWHDTTIGGIHWESPLVANGILYITDNNSKISAYALSGIVDAVGVYRPSNLTFFLRNSNTTGNADITINYGAANDLPVVGDWNGDGIDSIGVYRSSTGQFLLRDSNSPGAPQYGFVLGSPGDLPFAGRWSSTMTHDGVGVFRPSNGLIFLKNNLTTGVADFTMVLGIPGDKPVAGDWNGNGIDSPGVYRPSNATFYLTDKVCNCSTTADYVTTFGVAGDSPFAGDWSGTGISGLGVFRPSNGLIFLKNNPVGSGFATTTLVFGIANDRPVAGHWSTSTAIHETVTTPLPSLAPTFVPQGK